MASSDILSRLRHGRKDSSRGVRDTGHKGTEVGPLTGVPDVACRFLELPMSHVSVA